MARSIEQRGHHMTCAFIGMNRKLATYDCTSRLSLWTTLEYELVNANRGIQKVRVEPATRSAVATWIDKNTIKKTSSQLLRLSWHNYIVAWLRVSCLELSRLPLEEELVAWGQTGQWLSHTLVTSWGTNAIGSMLHIYHYLLDPQWTRCFRINHMTALWTT